MLLSLGLPRKAVMGISLKEGEFHTRGFKPGYPPAQLRLERVAKSVMYAYNTAVEIGEPERVAEVLEMLDPELRGFAYEGAAMGLTALDVFSPGRGGRLDRFVAGVAEHHSYMCYIGAGLALSVFRKRFEPFMAGLDPFTRWLVVDGYGFHNAYFRTKQIVGGHALPNFVRGYALEEFDAGVGRALWFIACGDPRRLKATVETFPEVRHASLWAGIGLAATYAGGVPRQSLEHLCAAAGSHIDALGHGSALACHARHRAGNPAPHVDMGSQVIWGLLSDEVHELTAALMAQMPRDGSELVPGEPAWQTFLHRLQTAHAAQRQGNTA